MPRGNGDPRAQHHGQPPQSPHTPSRRSERISKRTVDSISPSMPQSKRTRPRSGMTDCELSLASTAVLIFNSLPHASPTGSRDGKPPFRSRKCVSSLSHAHHLTDTRLSHRFEWTLCTGRTPFGATRLGLCVCFPIADQFARLTSPATMPGVSNGPPIGTSEPSVPPSATPRGEPSSIS